MSERNVNPKLSRSRWMQNGRPCINGPMGKGWHLARATGPSENGPKERQTGEGRWEGEQPTARDRMREGGSEGEGEGGGQWLVAAIAAKYATHVRSVASTKSHARLYAARDSLTSMTRKHLISGFLSASWGPNDQGVECPVYPFIGMWQQVSGQRPRRENGATVRRCDGATVRCPALSPLPPPSGALLGRPDPWGME